MSFFFRPGECAFQWWRPGANGRPRLHLWHYTSLGHPGPWGNKYTYKYLCQCGELRTGRWATSGSLRWSIWWLGRIWALNTWKSWLNSKNTSGVTHSGQLGVSRCGSLELILGFSGATFWRSMGWKKRSWGSVFFWTPCSSSRSNTISITSNLPPLLRTHRESFNDITNNSLAVETCTCACERRHDLEWRSRAMDLQFHTTTAFRNPSLGAQRGHYMTAHLQIGVNHCWSLSCVARHKALQEIIDDLKRCPFLMVLASFGVWHDVAVFKVRLLVVICDTGWSKKTSVAWVVEQCLGRMSILKCLGCASPLSGSCPICELSSSFLPKNWSVPPGPSIFFRKKADVIGLKFPSKQP